MAKLIRPGVEVRESFLAAMAEFRVEGRGGPDDESMIGADLRTARWNTPEEFAAYVRDLVAQTLEETPRAANFAPCTTLWWVEDREFLGRIAIRHRLTPWLAEVGGHIGYDVRPTARRRGHATAMLRSALPLAAQLGIDRALVLCAVDNTGSRLVIERNGGIPAESTADRLRFWIPTSPR